MADRSRWRAVIDHEVRRCRRCPLSREPGVKPVPPYGPLHPRIVVVGEAPGREENTAGRPFVGRSGILIREALSEAGLDPNKMGWTNTAQCFPDGPPPPESIERCHVHLRRILKVMDPDFVLLVGRHALGKVKPGARITQVHGRPIRGKRRTWYPVFHPAYVMRKQLSDVPALFREDIERFADLVNRSQ